MLSPSFCEKSLQLLLVFFHMWAQNLIFAACSIAGNISKLEWYVHFDALFLIFIAYSHLGSFQKTYFSIIHVVFELFPLLKSKISLNFLLQWGTSCASQRRRWAMALLMEKARRVRDLRERWGLKRSCCTVKLWQWRSSSISCRRGSRAPCLEGSDPRALEGTISLIGSLQSRLDSVHTLSLFIFQFFSTWHHDYFDSGAWILFICPSLWGSMIAWSWTFTFVCMIWIINQVVNLFADYFYKTEICLVLWLENTQIIGI